MYSSRHLPFAISHRGLRSGGPENTIPAFLAAIAAGADAIELDIHASADDVLFVHHDPAISLDGRTTPLASLDAAQIASCRLDGDAAVPTLDDTLTSIGASCGVFIEVKAAGIEPALVRCLRRHAENIDAYSVHAFDHRVVKRMLELTPSIRTGMLQVSYLIDSCAALRRSGATDLWQHSDFIDAALCNDVHSCGGRVIAWTPNRADDWQRLASAGVDGICTDLVDEYSAWRNTAAG